jgi:predicted ATPase
VATFTVRPPFVGRERELARLQTYVEAARQGHGSVVLVGGEPGIGKTRLLLEVAERARGAGLQVLAGRAQEPDGMPPYLPFAEALHGYPRTSGGESLGAQLVNGGADIAILLPSLQQDRPRRASPATSPELERYLLFESVSEFLLKTAGQAPGLLLILDDLHWADGPSLLLLQHLARRLAQASLVQRTPLLVLGAFREVAPDRAHRLADLLVEVRRERLGEQMLLVALSRTETATLIEHLVGVPPAVAVVEAMYRASAGNPFFTEELVRHLRAEGLDPSLAATATAEWGIPEGIRQVIGRRVTRLGEETQQMLRAAAVLGEAVHFECSVVSSQSTRPRSECAGRSHRRGHPARARRGLSVSPRADPTDAL